MEGVWTAGLINKMSYFIWLKDGSLNLTWGKRALFETTLQLLLLHIFLVCMWGYHIWIVRQSVEPIVSSLRTCLLRSNSPLQFASAWGKIFSPFLAICLTVRKQRNLAIYMCVEMCAGVGYFYVVVGMSNHCIWYVHHVLSRVMAH